MRVSLVAALAASVFATREAAADIPLVKANGWDVFLDGRLNTFASVSAGDAQPNGVAPWQGIEDRAAGTDNIGMSRIRSGFITNVLGLSLTKQLTPRLKVTGRFAIWAGVSQDRNKSDAPALDAREVYIRMEGPWGSVLAGRTLSLFERGAIMLDYDIHHAHGLGHPCAIRTVRGGACGFAGHGLLFPSFNAGVVYSTPDIRGIQVSVAAYDPATVSERSYERTPYPRTEFELTYRFRRLFHVFADGLWQRIGSNLDSELNPDAWGLAAGAGLELGRVALGVAAHTGQGLGLYVPMENSPLFSDDNYVLRKSRGLVGMGSLTFGTTKIAGGVGVSQLMKTGFEPAGPLAITFPSQQLGVSAGVYHGISETLFLALEYFYGYYSWYDSTSAGTPRQGVNFFNAGVTLVW
ncbi:MAG: porin [Myxococcales bacterium]